MQKKSQFPSDSLVKLKMSLEPCPFCGKHFKRLRSHLPHCRKSPCYKSTKTSNVHKQIDNFTPTTNKANTNKVNIDKTLNLSFVAPTKLKSKQVKKLGSLLQNTSIELPSTVTSTEGLNSDAVKPNMKWLAKREQEMLKLAKHLTQKKVKTSDSQKDKPYKDTTKTSPMKRIPQVERETVNRQNSSMETVLTSETNTKINSITLDLLQNDPWTISFQAVRSTTQGKTNATTLEQVQNNPKALTKYVLDPSAKEQEDQTFFQRKTSVWDHIRDGLYDKNVSVLVTNKQSKCGSNSVSVCKPQPTNNDSSAIKVFSAHGLPFMQISAQRPVEDMLKSRSENSVLAYTPDMATGYGGTQFVLCHSPIPLCEIECSRLVQYQGSATDQNLANVRLSELALWVSARRPTSAREGLAMLNKGWQWYYKKYIDVQKGGIGGIAMLITGYCVLSYLWNYPHLKQERWRKHH